MVAPFLEEGRRAPLLGWRVRYAGAAARTLPVFAGRARLVRVWVRVGVRGRVRVGVGAKVRG